MPHKSQKKTIQPANITLSYSASFMAMGYILPFSIINLIRTNLVRY
jgi:hypothetical protein